MLIINNEDEKKACTSPYGNQTFYLHRKEIDALLNGKTLGDPTYDEYGTFVRLYEEDLKHEKKIIKHGKPKPIRRFICYSCGCVFEADIYGYSREFDHNEDCYFSSCPECGAISYSVEKGENDDY